MKLAIVSATENEIIRVKQLINPAYIYGNPAFQIIFAATGVGILTSIFSIARLVAEHKPDLVLQAGIAGTFDENMPLGTVAAVKAEFAGDTGVEEEGIFKDLFDMKLQDENSFPFTGRFLGNPWLEKYNLLGLQEVTAITVNEISTRKERIEMLKAKYKPVLESMEGASLHYTCLQTSTPFIQVRAVSNYVGERDKAKWNFKLAFNNLAETMLEYIDQLHQSSPGNKIKT